MALCRSSSLSAELCCFSWKEKRLQKVPFAIAKKCLNGNYTNKNGQTKQKRAYGLDSEFKLYLLLPDANSESIALEMLTSTEIRDAKLNGRVIGNALARLIVPSLVWDDQSFKSQNDFILPIFNSPTAIALQSMSGFHGSNENLTRLLKNLTDSEDISNVTELIANEVALFTPKENEIDDLTNSLSVLSLSRDTAATRFKETPLMTDLETNTNTINIKVDNETQWAVEIRSISKLLHLLAAIMYEIGTNGLSKSSDMATFFSNFSPTTAATMQQGSWPSLGENPSRSNTNEWLDLINKIYLDQWLDDAACKVVTTSETVNKTTRVTERIDTVSFEKSICLLGSRIDKIWDSFEQNQDSWTAEEEETFKVRVGRVGHHYFFQKEALKETKLPKLIFREFSVIKYDQSEEDRYTRSTFPADLTKTSHLQGYSNISKLLGVFPTNKTEWTTELSDLLYSNLKLKIIITDKAFAKIIKTVAELGNTDVPAVGTIALKEKTTEAQFITAMQDIFKIYLATLKWLRKETEYNEKIDMGSRTKIQKRRVYLIKIFYSALREIFVKKTQANYKLPSPETLQSWIDPDLHNLPARKVDNRFITPEERLRQRESERDLNVATSSSEVTQEDLQRLFDQGPLMEKERACTLADTTFEKITPKVTDLEGSPNYVLNREKLKNHFMDAVQGEYFHEDREELRNKIAIWPKDYKLIETGHKLLSLAIPTVDPKNLNKPAPPPEDNLHIHNPTAVEARHVKAPVIRYHTIDEYLLGKYKDTWNFPVWTNKSYKFYFQKIFTAYCVTRNWKSPKLQTVLLERSFIEASIRHRTFRQQFDLLALSETVENEDDFLKIANKVISYYDTSGTTEFDKETIFRIKIDFGSKSLHCSLMEWANTIVHWLSEYYKIPEENIWKMTDLNLAKKASFMFVYRNPYKKIREQFVSMHSRYLMEGNLAKCVEHFDRGIEIESQLKGLDRNFNGTLNARINPILQVNNVKTVHDLDWPYKEVLDTCNGGRYENSGRYCELKFQEESEDPDQGFYYLSTKKSDLNIIQSYKVNYQYQYFNKDEQPSQPVNYNQQYAPKFGMGPQSNNFNRNFNGGSRGGYNQGKNRSMGNYGNGQRGRQNNSRGRGRGHKSQNSNQRSQRQYPYNTSQRGNRNQSNRGSNRGSYNKNAIRPNRAGFHTSPNLQSAFKSYRQDGVDREKRVRLRDVDPRSIPQSYHDSGRDLTRYVPKDKYRKLKNRIPDNNNRSIPKSFNNQTKRIPVNEVTIEEGYDEEQNHDLVENGQSYEQGYEQNHFDQDYDQYSEPSDSDYSYSNAFNANTVNVNRCNMVKITHGPETDSETTDASSNIMDSSSDFSEPEIGPIHADEVIDDPREIDCSELKYPIPTKRTKEKMALDSETIWMKILRTICWIIIMLLECSTKINHYSIALIIRGEEYLMNRLQEKTPTETSTEEIPEQFTSLSATTPHGHSWLVNGWVWLHGDRKKTFGKLVSESKRFCRTNQFERVRILRIPVLLDTGSQINLVTRGFLKQSGLDKKLELIEIKSIQVSGISNMTQRITHKVVIPKLSFRCAKLKRLQTESERPMSLSSVDLFVINQSEASPIILGGICLKNICQKWGMGVSGSVLKHKVPNNCLLFGFNFVKKIGDLLVVKFQQPDDTMQIGGRGIMKVSKFQNLETSISTEHIHNRKIKKDDQETEKDFKRVNVIFIGQINHENPDFSLGKGPHAISIRSADNSKIQQITIENNENWKNLRFKDRYGTWHKVDIALNGDDSSNHRYDLKIVDLEEKLSIKAQDDAPNGVISSINDEKIDRNIGYLWVPTWFIVKHTFKSNRVTYTDDFIGASSSEESTDGDSESEESHSDENDDAAYARAESDESQDEDTVELRDSETSRSSEVELYPENNRSDSSEIEHLTHQMGKNKWLTSTKYKPLGPDLKYPENNDFRGCDRNPFGLMDRGMDKCRPYGVYEGGKSTKYGKLNHSKVLQTAKKPEPQEAHPENFAESRAVAQAKESSLNMQIDQLLEKAKKRFRAREIDDYESRQYDITFELRRKLRNQGMGMSDQHESIARLIQTDELRKQICKSKQKRLDLVNSECKLIYTKLAENIEHLSKRFGLKMKTEQFDSSFHCHDSILMLKQLSLISESVFYFTPEINKEDKIQLQADIIEAEKTFGRDACSTKTSSSTEEYYDWIAPNFDEVKNDKTTDSASKKTQSCPFADHDARLIGYNKHGKTFKIFKVRVTPEETNQPEPNSITQIYQKFQNHFSEFQNPEKSLMPAVLENQSVNEQMCYDIRTASRVLEPQIDIDKTRKQKALYKCLGEIYQSHAKQAPSYPLEKLPKGSIINGVGFGGRLDLNDLDRYEKIEKQNDHRARVSQRNIFVINDQFDNLTTDRKLNGNSVHLENPLDEYICEIGEDKMESDLKNSKMYNIKHGKQLLEFRVHKSTDPKILNDLFSKLAGLKALDIFLPLKKGEYMPYVPGIRVNLLFKPNSALPCHKPQECPRDLQMATYETIQQHIEMGVLEPINPELLRFSFPIFVIAKKDTDKKRLIMDFARKKSGCSINSAVQICNASLPSVHDCLNKVRHKTYLSTVDFSSAYFSLALSEESSNFLTSFLPKLSFLGPEHQWKSSAVKAKRLAMGLSTACSVFHAFVQLIIRTLHSRLLPKNKTVFTNFIDDVIIGSDTVEEHRDALCEFFNLVKDLKLIVPCKKIRLFGYKEATILGFQIRDNMIQLKRDYQDAIKKFTPESINTYKNYMGLAGLVNFCSTNSPWLVELLSRVRKCVQTIDGNKKIVWTHESREALAVLKSNLGKTLGTTKIETKTSDSGIFGNCLVIHTDASRTSGGAIIQQNQKCPKTGKGRLVVIDFFTKMFPEAWSKTKSIAELEGFVICKTIHRYEAFVLSPAYAVIVRTDNSALLSIIRNSRRSSVYQDLLCLIADRSRFLYFDHVPTTNGSISNSSADFLSRLYCKPSYDVPKGTDFQVFFEKRMKEIENNGKLARYPHGALPKVDKEERSRVDYYVKKIRLNNVLTFTEVNDSFQHGNTVRFLESCGDLKQEQVKKVLRNVRYNLRSNDKTPETLNEVIRDEQRFRKEAADADSIMDKLQNKNVETEKVDFKQKNTIIDLDGYLEEKERQKINKNLTENQDVDEFQRNCEQFSPTKSENLKEIARQEVLNPFVKRRDDEQTQHNQKSSHFEDNLNAFAKTSEKFKLERKEGDLIDNPADRFIKKGAPFSLEQMHLQHGLHRTPHECKILFNLSNREFEDLVILVNSCAICSKYKYKNRQQVTRYPQPSVNIPLIPGSMYEMDIAEMDEVPTADENDCKGKVCIPGKYKYLLVIVEKVSTYVFAYPMIAKNIPECLRVMKLFTAHIGVTGLVSVDQDSTLASNNLKTFYKEAGLRLRVFEKDGSTAAEVSIALIRRRLAATHGSWFNKLHLIIKEINIQRRRTSYNLSPFEIFYSRSVDINFYLGTNQNEYPITQPLNLDYARIRREIVAQRSYNMNRKNLTVGNRVIIKTDDTWILDRIYKIVQQDENGLLLKLDTVDNLKVSNPNDKRTTVSRRWDQVRPA